MSLWFQRLTDSVLGIDRTAGSPLLFLNQLGNFLPETPQALTRRTFTITAAEILDIVANPPLIVPAPVAGSMNQIVNISSSLVFNTTAYVDAGGSAGADLRYNASGVNFAVDVAQLGDMRTMILGVASAVCVAKGSPQAPLAPAAFDGAEIRLLNVNGGANDFTLGDSDILVDVCYTTSVIA